MSLEERKEKLEQFEQESLNDYYLACLSRELSRAGRREVHNGKAHFGIFGDGKELVQIAYSKFFRKGDWRSGYYRDQTFMLALGLLDAEEFFSMIYGDTNLANNPSTGGRNFNNHFSTPNVDEQGNIRDLMNRFNSSSDISSTAGQMPRLLGLAQASKIVREQAHLKEHLNNNVHGNELAFGSIGDASTSEGMFFETINAAGVMQVPLAVCVYDDGFGISVPKELQTTKGSISAILKGFEKEQNTNGIYIYKCKAWDYENMLKVFKEGTERCREEQVPVLFHAQEVTQPLGHSSSGSHERYKSEARLVWEKEYDCNQQFRKYLLEKKIANESTLVEIEKAAIDRVKQAKKKAWSSYLNSYGSSTQKLEEFANAFADNEIHPLDFSGDIKHLKSNNTPSYKAHHNLAKKMSLLSRNIPALEKEREMVLEWIKLCEQKMKQSYRSQLHREGKDSALNAAQVKPTYNEAPEQLKGCEILSENFHHLFKKHPQLVTFGEDTGFMGDVNQGMKGMQLAYGKHRVSDTGIREATIIGQGVGLALRGFRPIAEIQYLDYIYYALPTLTDDVASLQYRTAGKMVCPIIVRTRGHQLQGIWHSGSPMQMLLGSTRGMFLAVPRNMVQAAGIYNTLLEGNDPAIVIEPLKGYNTKENRPSNPGEYKLPLGVPEVLKKGKDVTLVTYGWNVHLALEAANILEEAKGISVELIDVRTLMPFDVNHLILESVKKTNKVVFLDEDVPGGASSYMMQKVLQEQKAFNYLDCEPICISAAENRPAYGIDGEHFTKPNVYEIVERLLNLVESTNIAISCQSF